jgi:hypothetical protein
MSARSFLAVFSLLALVSVAGCNKDPVKLEPETRGKRGENCQARNDCQSGLACLNGICSKNEFDIDVATKQCDRIDCSETADCCGDKPTEVPSKCADRNTYCISVFPGCSASQICTSDAQCGGEGGTCRPEAATGTCQNGPSITVGLSCSSPATCRDTCAASGFCTLSSVACSVDSECAYYAYNSQVTCTKPSRTCNCTNPDYDGLNPICSDPDCTGQLCLLRCEDERCVTDRSCTQNADCSQFGLPLCDGGRCVECKKSTDCDDDETCEEGTCHTPCKHDEECPLFYGCDSDSGECEYVGCKTDRECVLAATRNVDPENPQSVPTNSGEDARLQKCLPSAGSDFKTCKIPCENDGSCGAQSVCDSGFCKFIGCENDAECRAYLNIASQIPTDAKPYVSTAVCREAPTK